MYFHSQEDEIFRMDTCKSNECWLVVPIPVQGRKGNGYIFHSDFITAEEAQREAESI